MYVHTDLYDTYLQGHRRPIVHIAAVSGPCIGYGTRTREARERNLDTIAIGSTYISNLYVNRVTYGLWLEETLCRKETSLYVSIRVYGVLIVFTLYLYRYIHKILDVSKNA